MRYLHALLLLLATTAASAQIPTVPLPHGTLSGAPDTGLSALARQTLARHQDDDPQRRLTTQFRLQLAAGQYTKAIDSIHALRRLRADPPGQAPIFLQYEVFARAMRHHEADGTPFATAWQQAFAALLSPLDDRSAYAAQFAFNGYLPRMRADLDAQLARANGKHELPLADALELVRAWQVYTAYAAFQPFVTEAFAADDTRRYHIQRDLLVSTPGGAQISALLVRPASTQQPLPALLTFTIYANDDWAWDDAKKMAAHGYASVVAYSRGKGRSPDAITPFLHDGEDAAAVINWMAAQPWSNGVVGMYGGSYSAYTQWAALRHRPPALKAIATSASAAPGIDVPMEGNVFMNFIYAWPAYVASNRSLDDASYGDATRWRKLDSNAYRSGRRYRDLPAIDGTPNPVFDEWLRHPGYDSYWQARIPQGADYAGIDIPVLATTGYFDGAQIGVLHYLREHLRQRPDADHTLLIGPYEHFTMQTGVPPQVQGYEPDAVARIDLQALRLAWFDHVLRGAAKPELLAGRVNWQVMGADTWRHAASLDAMATRQRRLYLQPAADGTHTLGTTPAPEAVSLQRIDFTDRSDADWQPSPTVVNTALDAHSGLAFRSEPFAQATELAGPFTATLDFTLNKADADIAFAIYEQTADGRYLDLAYGRQRLSYARDRNHRQLLEAGKRHQVQLHDTRLLGRRVAAGSRVVVTLGVIKQPDRQLNLGSGKEPSDETLADAAAPMEIRWFGSSHIDLPVRD